MAQEPEVTEHELEATRHALAEKLEQIGEKISGTVETVSDAVSSVTQTVENVTDAVEGTMQTVADSVSGTVESVKDTVTAVGERASETVEAVKEAFNLSEQVRQRPWLCWGGSVAVGFVLGKLFAPRSHRTAEADSFARGSGYYAAAPESESPRAGNGRHWGSEDETTSTSEKTQKPSMLSGVMEQFGPELNRLKELALGALFGVARDMAAQAVPESLKDQVQTIVNDITEKVGGKPIQGSVLPESDQDSHQESASTKGDEHEQSNPTEMERSMGAAERKSKAGVGKSNRR